MRSSARAAACNHIIAWLLEPGDPSLAFRACAELMRRSRSDPKVAALAKVIPGRRRSADGAFGTTHFCLSYFSELGLDRTTDAVARAAERYLGLQNPDGDWYDRFSCLDGCNIRTFLRLGYCGDLRLGEGPSGLL